MLRRRNCHAPILQNCTVAPTKSQACHLSEVTGFPGSGLTFLIKRVSIQPLTFRTTCAPSPGVDSGIATDRRHNKPERAIRQHRRRCRLAAAEICKISVTNALGCGQQKGYLETYRGVDVEVNLLKRSAWRSPSTRRTSNPPSTPLSLGPARARSATARSSSCRWSGASASARARKAVSSSGSCRNSTGRRTRPAPSLLTIRSASALH
jgi:hypothetical protein